MNDRIKVISFDETGKYEGEENGIRFLAGILYRGDKFKNYLEDEKKLEAYLLEICKEFNRKKGKNISFPKDFHMSGLSKEEKKFILDRVIKYLEENKDKYELFVFAVPNTESVKNEMTDINELINFTDILNDGNLYERVAILAVFNFVFYSLDMDTKKLIFRLPARTLPMSKDAGERFERVSSSRDAKAYFSLVNKSTFKSSVATKIYENNSINDLAIKNLEVRVDSINYSGTGNNSPILLYLSDMICSYFRMKFIEINETTDFIINSDIIEKIKKTTELDVIFWVYDNVDRIWRQALESYASCDLVKMYSLIFDIKESGSDYSEYYINNWVKKLEDMVDATYINSDDKFAKFKANLPKYIIDIEAYMRGENSYYKGRYIAEKIQIIIKSYLNEKREDLNYYMYKIYDILLRFSNHTSNISESELYLKKIVELEKFIPHEEYLAVINRAMQIYFNSCQFEKIIDIYKYVIPFAENIKNTYVDFKNASTNVLNIIENQDEKIDLEIKKEETIPLEKNISFLEKVFNALGNLFTKSKKETLVQNARAEIATTKENSVKFSLLGKLYSTLGQAYAFSEDYKNSKMYFEKALAEFDKNGDDKINYAITLGYMMHLFISENKSEDYINYSQEFYKDKKAKEFTKAVIENINRNRYDLFILLKMLSELEVSKCNRKELVKLINRNLEDSNYKGHPWQLIYKYMYLNCKKYGFGDEVANKYLEKISIDEDDVGLIRFIKLKFELEYKDSITGDILDENIKMAKEIGLNLTRENIKKDLKKYLTYMYD